MGGWPVRSARARPAAPPAPVESEGTLSGPWHCCPWWGQWSPGLPLGLPEWTVYPAWSRCREETGVSAAEGPRGQRVGSGESASGGWTGPAAAKALRGSGRRRWVSPEGGLWGRALDRAPGSRRGTSERGLQEMLWHLGVLQASWGTWVLDKRNKLHPV